MKTLFVFLVATLMFCVGFQVGVHRVITAYQKDFYSQVEYASETDNKLYQKMTKMKRNSTLLFNGFPASLTSILFLNTAPGDSIVNAGDSTLILVSRDLNRTDINKYPYYVIKDEKNNLWSLFRHNDKYRLTRLDESEYQEWLMEKEKQMKTN